MGVRTILFVCVGNAARSQMAEALLNARAAERGLDVSASSAGTHPGAAVSSLAIEALAEMGIEHSGKPRLLTKELVDQANKVITMGCGVDSAACPAGMYVSADWGLDDPGPTIESMRTIRDQISERVDRLLDEFTD